MRISEVNEIRPFLNSVFDHAERMSVAVSGSMSRGDFRVREDEVVSDLDLIPVVDDIADVADARLQLLPALRQISDRFQVTCTAAITLSTHFLRTRHAGYVTSMSASPFVCDPLGLQNRLEEADTCAQGSPLPWHAQPVTYYLAKAGYTKPTQNLAKARTATERLLTEAPVFTGALATLGQEPGHDEVQLACLDVLRTVVEAHRVQLLPSSQEFLDGIGAGRGGAEIFEAVRSRAFLENQGISFEQSSLMAQPTALLERA
ncbi:hypothetical protein ACF087_35385 [Streptomyces goshikiensis]|uniref:hypothetical protein n=1 Tax=Streptomyces goshikiensis TaxID=1942 RepID=UPI0036FF9320